MSHPTAFSHLAGREVSTWSEDWRHECEVNAVLAMTPDQRRAFLEGTTEPRQTGVVQVRGQAAVERIREDMQRLAEMRRAKRA